MSIIVFWLDEYETDSLAPTIEVESQHRQFKDTELSQALAFAEQKRNDGKKHVTISSELGDCVGKPGVSAVENGKTPDGHDYEWSKKHRGNPSPKE